MYPSRISQIAHLNPDKPLTEVPNEYIDFADIFLPKLAIKLLEHTRINNHAIELVDDWHPSYGLIYSLGPVELEILKTYIKKNLVNCFIRPFKSPTRISIVFDKKPDNSLRLCVDYQSPNNLIIKNQYPLPLVGKSLDWVGWVWHFI